jgi:hypothetical protein
MQSDDDLQTTLSKWPFILGDGLLVATALAIAILGQWQLTNWQVAACVVSVALGAALFVLPYVVEFQVRVREESEDRSADMRILQRHFIHAQDQLEAVSDRIEGLESQPKVKVIETLRADLAAVRAQVSTLEAQVADVAKKVEMPAKLSVAPSDTSDAEPPAEESVSGPKVDKVTKATKVREPRKRRTPEPRLLERAIDSKRDHSSAAVSRIIESKKKHSASGEAVEDRAPAVDKPMAQPEGEDAPEDEGTPEDENAPESERPVEASSTEAEREAPPVKTEDMFAEAVPPQISKRVRIKKSDTVVMASVFIGIGNKPYVRGSGAGLNWESGVAMEFEEIGKWRWLAPADLESPIEIQLYRNDEDPDATGRHRLEPGRILELSPVF